MWAIILDFWFLKKENVAHSRKFIKALLSKSLNKFLRKAKIMSFLTRQIPISYVMQPIIATRNNELSFFEILGRLHKKNGQILAVSPDVAAKYTNILINYAYTIVKHRFLNGASVTINISKNETNLKTINLLINTFNCKEANKVLVEVTEDVLIDSNKAELLVKLKDHGFKLALDDFCSEKSVRNLICDFDFIYIVKFDGVFMQNINKGQDKLIDGLKYLNSFAKSIGKETIIEYIENIKLYDAIKHIEVDYLQGYYLGRPQSLEAYEKISCIP